MKRINLLLATGLITLMFSACCNNNTDCKQNNNQQNTTVIAESNVAPAYTGTYLGTLPCADCEGIETTIVLNADGTYTQTQLYLKGSDKTRFEEQGKIKYAASTQMLTLNNGKETSLYKLEGNKLIQLDTQGKAAEGDLANLYILIKQQ